MISNMTPTGRKKTLSVLVMVGNKNGAEDKFVGHTELLHGVDTFQNKVGSEKFIIYVLFLGYFSCNRFRLHHSDYIIVNCVLLLLYCI